MAILTIHNWNDLAAGLAELRRVARRQVLFVFEPLTAHSLWLTSYFDSMSNTERNAPSAVDVAEHLDIVENQVLWIPADCRDATAAAFWNRPEAYLDPAVQQANSYMSLMDPTVRERGLRRLSEDLESGRWDERHGHLRSEQRADYGYRLLIAGEN